MTVSMRSSELLLQEETTISSLWHEKRQSRPHMKRVPASEAGRLFLVPAPPTPVRLLFLAERVKERAWGEQKIERRREEVSGKKEVVREKINRLQTLILNISPNSIRRQGGI